MRSSEAEEKMSFLVLVFCRGKREREGERDGRSEQGKLRERNGRSEQGKQRERG